MSSVASFIGKTDYVNFFSTNALTYCRTAKTVSASIGIFPVKSSAFDLLEWISWIVGWIENGLTNDVAVVTCHELLVKPTTTSTTTTTATTNM